MNHNPQKIPRVSPYEIWYKATAERGPFRVRLGPRGWSEIGPFVHR